MTFQIQSENNVIYFEQNERRKGWPGYCIGYKGVNTADRLPVHSSSPGIEYELIQAEWDVIYFERIKDEKEQTEQFEDES